MTSWVQTGMELSPIYKALLVVFCGLPIPLSAISFVNIRRGRKQKEFHRAIAVLGIASEEAEFAHDRVIEQYAARDYYVPVALVWTLTAIGFIGLFFGAEMVSEHEGKVNFVLTGAMDLGDPARMQHLRVQSMVVLVWAFVGAYMWACLYISRRIISGDLAPSVYVGTAIRIILAPVLSLATTFLTEAAPEWAQGGGAALPAMAFLIGFFPDEALVYLRQKIPVFSSSDQRSAHPLPLGMMEGINVFDRARLSELEINDAQNLATADLVEILVRTPFRPSQVIDWIGQAYLFVYFKDDVGGLRRYQIRSIFDLVALHGHEEALAKLAEHTGVSLFGLGLVCEQASRDSKITQLNRFRDLLACRTADTADVGTAVPRLVEPSAASKVVDAVRA